MAVLFDAEGNEVQVPDDVLAGAATMATTTSDNTPKGLRDHAKGLKTDLDTTKEENATLAAKLAAYERRDKFAEAMSTAGVTDITLEDLADIPAEQINPTLLKVKAEEKAQVIAGELAKQAKANGFVDDKGNPDTEGWKAAVEALRSQRVQEATDQTASAAAIRSSSSPGAPAAKTADQLAEEAFVEARKKNLPMDAARQEAVKALLAPVVQTPGVV